MTAPNWTVLDAQIRQAFADLGIDSQSGARPAQILGLYQTCPACVPQDGAGNSNAYVIRAVVRDVDAGKDRVCGCTPYVVTQDVYDAACAALARMPFGGLHAPCGYGWIMRADDGSPIFVAPPSPPPGPPDPIEPPPAPTRARSSSGIGGLLAFVGIVTTIAFAAERARR